MNPIDWLQDNLFYTDEKTKQINDAMQRNAGNPLRPGQPEGEDTVYAGKFADLRGSVTPGSNQPAASNLGEGGSMDAAERHRAGAGYPAGVTRPSDYPVAFVPDSTLNTNNNNNGGGNRDNSRVIPGSGGKVQKGTDMGRSFNDLLATTNTSGYQPFSSNQLPTTAGSPDSGVTPKTQAILAGIQAGKQTDMSIDGYKGPGYTTIQPDNPQFAEAFGQDLADKYKNSGDAKVTGYTKGGRLDQALAGVKNEVEMTPERRQQMASMAFLNTEDSMLALRAKEAVNGVVYAQQNHYVAGSDPNGPAQKITRSQARDISNGRAEAQDFLTKKVDDLKKETPDTPAESQDPLSAAGSAVRDGFAAGAKTDFSLNNSQSTPQRGVGPTVDLDDIPKDLSGEAGKKYLADLDAGRLFK